MRERTLARFEPGDTKVETAPAHDRHQVTTRKLFNLKHQAIDLAAEIKRAALPDGLHGFLFPMYEAISNALHSIESFL